MALTLLPLALGGAVFIAVFSVRSSLLRTIDEVLKYGNYDIDVGFSHPYHFTRVEREALRAYRASSKRKARASLALAACVRVAVKANQYP